MTIVFFSFVWFLIMTVNYGAHKINGRDVSDFVLEFWILNFELFLLHFILESLSMKSTVR